MADCGLTAGKVTVIAAACQDIIASLHTGKEKHILSILNAYMPWPVDEETGFAKHSGRWVPDEPAGIKALNDELWDAARF